MHGALLSLPADVSATQLGQTLGTLDGPHLAVSGDQVTVHPPTRAQRFTITAAAVPSAGWLDARER